jgi:P27 family predicted phage terminase small subunit
MPPCPKNFDKNAKDEWFKTTAQLQKWGILGECDMSLLEIYVYNISLSKKAIEELEKEGHVLHMVNTKGQEYVAKNPWMDVFKQSADFAQKLGTLFGFNPSARAKIAKPEKPKEDDFEKLSGRASA